VPLAQADPRPRTTEARVKRTGHVGAVWCPLGY
jgi:hypothetical protein